ncbi:hypothetical protein pb186bvf_007847 [Paramecium bursaria]
MRKFFHEIYQRQNQLISFLLFQNQQLILYHIPIFNLWIAFLDGVRGYIQGRCNFGCKDSSFEPPFEELQILHLYHNLRYIYNL